MDELMAAIERVANGGSYVDPRLDRILLSPRATAHVPQLWTQPLAFMGIILSIGVAVSLLGNALVRRLPTVKERAPWGR